MVSPTGFKHTGVFPEQAVNWAWYAKKIRRRGPARQGAEPVRLHRRGHPGLRGGGGQRLPCGRLQGHRGLGAGKTPPPAAWQTGPSAGWWTTAPSSWPGRSRRGSTYDGIIMDPPSYGRGPGGEVWKLEDSIYDLISPVRAGC